MIAQHTPGPGRAVCIPIRAGRATVLVIDEEAPVDWEELERIAMLRWWGGVIR